MSTFSHCHRHFLCKAVSTTCPKSLCYWLVPSAVIIAVSRIKLMSINSGVLLFVQIFLPMFRSGFRQITQGLLTDTYLEAHVCSTTILKILLFFIIIVPLIWLRHLLNLTCTLPHRTATTQGLARANKLPIH